MRVGSLVVCTEVLTASPDIIPFVRWIPQVDNLYTIRAITEDSNLLWVVLEEGVIGTFCNIEIHAIITAFREIQPPLDLSLLLSEIETFAGVNP